jgi:hypothetical protein
MNDKKTVGLMPKVSKEKTNGNPSSAPQADVVESFKKMVESGVIQEFIITALDSDGQVVLASFCEDITLGLGILEMGKFALINQSVE